MKKKAKYDTEPVNYSTVNEADQLYLISTVRKGLNYNDFIKLSGGAPFNMNEWPLLLHMSERTFQRYKKDKKSFDTLQTEKIIQITLLCKKGEEVFGDMDKFHSWLDQKNIALGGAIPKDFLDSSFGINLLKDELIRIENGIFA